MQDQNGFNAKDLNLYRFVNNDPVNHVDPMGSDIIFEAKAIWAAYRAARISLFVICLSTWGAIRLGIGIGKMANPNIDPVVQAVVDLITDFHAIICALMGV